MHLKVSEALKHVHVTVFASFHYDRVLIVKHSCMNLFSVNFDTLNAVLGTVGIVFYKQNFYLILIRGCGFVKLYAPARCLTLKRTHFTEAYYN